MDLTKNNIKKTLEKINMSGHSENIVSTGILKNIQEKFENEYNLEEYGVTLSEQNEQLVVDKLNWKGEAKKSGVQMGDIISNFKIENPDRPNKAIVYPFSFLLLLIFGYNNYRRKQE